MWPLRRSGHATSFLPNHNALMIVGGEEKGNTLCDDSWVFEFEKRIWKKVRHHIMYHRCIVDSHEVVIIYFTQNNVCNCIKFQKFFAFFKNYNAYMQWRI